MFLLFCLSIAIIAIWRGIMPFKMAKWLKIVLSLWAFLIAFNFVILRVAGLENLPVPVLLLSFLLLYSALAPRLAPRAYSQAASLR